MATWLIGDVHGCAEELRELLERIAPGADDRVVVVGDLYHRGPDPVGVMETLRAAGADFILGNHELRLLARLGLAPRRIDASDRPARREDFPPLEADDVAGDGRRPCHAPAERRADLVRFLQGHAGFFLESDALAGAGPTPDGRRWCVVHAGVVPGRAPAHSEPEDLVALRRLPLPGRPFWYEVYAGPNLVIYGHTPHREPRVTTHDGRAVAIGIDTGCVYGGRLTAYSPERDAFVSVPAARTYAARA